MSNYIALKDARLEGEVATNAHLHLVRTKASVSLMNAFAQINSIASRVGAIRALFILCHGYAGTNNSAGVCMDAGGMGLQLGRENVLHNTVSIWTAIQNKVENIIVYSCAAANTESGNEGTWSDGRYLMGALAIHTNADVYAADRIQWYSRSAGNIYNFGRWEGQLLHFPPSGTSSNRVSAPPVELSDLM